MSRRPRRNHTPAWPEEVGFLSPHGKNLMNQNPFGHNVPSRRGRSSVDSETARTYVSICNSCFCPIYGGRSESVG
jgi:hypothetical protein